MNPRRSLQFFFHKKQFGSWLSYRTLVSLRNDLCCFYTPYLESFKNYVGFCSHYTYLTPINNNQAIVLDFLIENSMHLCAKLTENDDDLFQGVVCHWRARILSFMRYMDWTWKSSAFVHSPNRRFCFKQLVIYNQVILMVAGYDQKFKIYSAAPPKTFAF